MKILIPLRNLKIAATFLINLINLLGCASPKSSPPQFVLFGVVEFKHNVVEDAVVSLEVCEGIKWISNGWTVRTDHRGRYRIKVELFPWTNHTYRVRVLYQDKRGGLHLSEWKHGTVGAGTVRQDFKM